MKFIVDSWKDLPEKLKFLREGEGMSARGLSIKAEYDPSYVSMIESGSRFPRLDAWEKLFGALGYQMIIQLEK